MHSVHSYLHSNSFLNTDFLADALCRLYSHPDSYHHCNTDPHADGQSDPHSDSDADADTEPATNLGATPPTSPYRKGRHDRSLRC